MTNDATLREAIVRLARVPQLLVCCDYDGTLAPIVDTPGDARPRRESVAALRALAALPDTSVAVISGRSLHDLAALPVEKMTRGVVRDVRTFCGEREQSDDISVMALRWLGPTSPNP